MKSRTTRRIVAKAVSLVPGNWLRLACFRILLGYRIDKGVNIGRRSIIDAGSVAIAQKCKIDKDVRVSVHRLSLGRETRLASGVRASGPFVLEIGEETSVQRDVEFYAGDWARPDAYALACVIGSKVAISPTHFFDVVGGLTIGNGTWFAGRGTQVWTHGLGRGGPVVVGENCYVGSAVRIAPNTSIADRTLVAMGSVVTKTVDEPGCLVAGNPADIKARRYQPILEWHA